MTSIASESVATILCSCKQTRFHIENPNYRELDIEGLNITVTSGEKTADKRAKAKAKGEGVEILSNAKLRLKAGQRYALIGRNGSGKSTLLRAIAERLIPGIPEETRIAILQQTNAGDASGDAVAQGDASANKDPCPGPTVLEEVIDKATARSELEKEIKVLSSGVSANDGYAAVRSLRRVRHERLQKKLFVLDKDARLRSGARGMQARKALTAFEKVVAESEELLSQDETTIPPETLQKEIQEATDLLSDLQLQVEPSKLAETESKAKKILTGLGFTEAYTSKPVSNLSGGWLMRTALAAALLQETDLLILDEPTNYLDLLGIIWLQRHLQSLSDTPDPPTLILVSHDRDFISQATTDLLILKDKSLTYFHGALPTYESAQSERKLYLSKMKEAQDRQKAHIQETIARNVRQGKKNDDDNRLRQAKSRQKKLDERWGLQVNARGGRFKLNRDLAGHHFSARAEIDVPADEKGVAIGLPEPAELRFPGPLVSLEGVAFRYHDPGPPRAKSGVKLPPPALVLEDVTLSVHAGDRVAVLGLNGAGKSTLIKLLVGSASPTSGTVAVHPRLKTGYYSQHAVEALQRLSLSQPDLTALSLLTREVGGELDEGDLRGLLASLGLAGRTASDVPLGKLSGGQLVRCELARLLWRRPQLLVLDEVTTHLDYETITALREALRGWEGAVVLVSHDRWFVRGVVEGVVDEDEEGGEGESCEDGEEVARRREVYQLKGGRLVRLPGGVGEFEEGVEKRVRKLLRE